MRIQIRSNMRSGIILIDILAALALGAAFVASIAYASGSARDMFETAREREYALDLYEKYKDEFKGMMPHEVRRIVIEPEVQSTVRIGTTTIEANARWYGNDMVETVVSIGGDSRNMRRAGPIVFNAVRVRPLGAPRDAAGTSLCSVDLARSGTVGSYEYQHPISRVLVPSIVPISLPIDPLLPLTDIEVRSGIVYISADSAAAGAADLVVADIRDPEDPSVVSSINTGPGIVSIALAGERVFAAAASAVAQLHVIKFLDLATPTLESKYQVPLPYASATPPFASSISYDSGLVYLGTEKWAGNEFTIIDVANGTAPRELSGLEVGAKVLDIALRDGFAHIAAAGQDQMIAVGIANPHDPIVMNKFGPSGWERQEGRSVLTFEDDLIFSRTSGGFNIKADHELFSGAAVIAEDPSSSVDVAGGIYGIVADRSHIFAASRGAGKELVAFDRLLSATSSISFALPSTPQAMTCDGDRLYILATGAPVIYQITFR